MKNPLENKELVDILEIVLSSKVYPEGTSVAHIFQEYVTNLKTISHAMSPDLYYLTKQYYGLKSAILPKIVFKKSESLYLALLETQHDLRPRLIDIVIIFQHTLLLLKRAPEKRNEIRNLFSDFIKLHLDTIKDYINKQAMTMESRLALFELIKRVHTNLKNESAYALMVDIFYMDKKHGKNLIIPMVHGINQYIDSQIHENVTAVDMNPVVNKTVECFIEYLSHVIEIILHDKSIKMPEKQLLSKSIMGIFEDLFIYYKNSEVMTLRKIIYLNGALIASSQMAEQLHLYLEKDDVAWIHEAKLYSIAKFLEGIKTAKPKTYLQAMQEGIPRSVIQLYAVVQICLAGELLLNTAADRTLEDRTRNFHMMAANVIFFTTVVGVSTLVSAHTRSVSLKDARVTIKPSEPFVWKGMPDKVDVDKMDSEQAELKRQKEAARQERAKQRAEEDRKRLEQIMQEEQARKENEAKEKEEARMRKLEEESKKLPADQVKALFHTYVAFIKNRVPASVSIFNKRREEIFKKIMEKSEGSGFLSDEALFDEIINQIKSSVKNIDVIFPGNFPITAAATPVVPAPAAPPIPAAPIIPAAAPAAPAPMPAAPAPANNPPERQYYLFAGPDIGGLLGFRAPAVRELGGEKIPNIGSRTPQ